MRSWAFTGPTAMGLPATTTAAAPTATFASPVPDDGEYILSIRDHLGQGGVDYAYRIEVTPIVPALTLGLPERAQYVDTTLPVPQGNRLAALVSAQRVDFGGDVQLNFKDLPPGISVETIPMAANRTDVPVLFTAVDGAALGREPGRSRRRRSERKSSR